MSVKRGKRRQGFIEHGTIAGTFDGQQERETIDAMKETLAAASPRGRVGKWRRLAERLDAGHDEIDAAEALIDRAGRVKDEAEFRYRMERAARIIEMAAAEAVVPKVILGERSSERGRQSRAKKEKHFGITEAQRNEYNQAMVEEFKKINLNRKKPMTRNEFVNKYAEKYYLKPNSAAKILRKLLPR